MVIFEILKRGIISLGFAGLLTFIFLTIFVIQGQEIPVSDIWLNMLGSILVCLYFSFASFIFNYERWSLLIQFSVHYSLSIMLFLLIAVMLTGWIPFTFKSVISGMLIFTTSYILFMGCEYLYIKQLEKKLNRSLLQFSQRENNS